MGLIMMSSVPIYHVENNKKKKSNYRIRGFVQTFVWCAEVFVRLLKLVVLKAIQAYR